jgi:hypothetical protein
MKEGGRRKDEWWNSAFRFLSLNSEPETLNVSFSLFKVRRLRFDV